MTASNIVLRTDVGHLFADGAIYSRTDWGRVTQIASKIFVLEKAHAAASTVGPTFGVVGLMRRLAAFPDLASLVDGLPAAMAAVLAEMRSADRECSLDLQIVAWSDGPIAFPHSIQIWAIAYTSDGTPSPSTPVFNYTEPM